MNDPLYVKMDSVLKLVTIITVSELKIKNSLFAYSIMNEKTVTLFKQSLEITAC